MKKKLICLLVAGALPGFAGAASTSAQIKALQAQLNALQAQVKELRTALASQHGAAGGGAPGWLEAALSRLSERLGMPKQPAPPHVCDAIVSELVARADEHRSFCLYHARLNGGADVPASV